MSLHLANLSPKIRKDDLESVFRKYGPCSVQLKAGFAFADYDFPGDAELALRSLSGRKICGESIILSWSNKQGNPHQRSVGAAKNRDVQYGRDYDRGNNKNHWEYSRSHEEYSVRNEFQDDGRGRRMFSEGHNDRESFNHKKLGHVPYNHRKEWLGGAVRADFRQADYGRRAERSHSFQNGNDLEGETAFDRYEPGHEDERSEEYYSRRETVSRNGDTSLTKKRWTNHDEYMGDHTCYKCGAIGHKRSDCPMKDATQGRRSYHTDDMPDTNRNTIVGRNVVGGSESRSVGRLQPCRNSESRRRYESDRFLSHAEKAGVDGNNSQGVNYKGNSRTAHNTKRQREWEDEAVERHHDKKSRILASPCHSGYSSPDRGTHLRSKPLPSLSVRSRSPSPIPHSGHSSPDRGTHLRPKPLPSLSVRSKSPSPIPHSHSASSVSNSRSNISRSRSIMSNCRSRSRSRSCTRTRTRTKSRSRSPSSSPSISLGRSLSLSPDNGLLYVNGTYNGVSNARTKEVSPEVGQQFEPEVREECLFIAGRVDLNLGGSPQSEEALVERQKVGPDLKDEIPVSTINQDCLDANLEGGEISKSEDVVLEEGEFLGHSLMQIECENADVPATSEVNSLSGSVREDVELNKLSSDDINHVHSVSCEVQVPNSSLLEKVDKDIDVGETGPQKSPDNEDLDNADPVQQMKEVEPADQSDLKVPSKKHYGSHLSISMEEYCTALNHFGLKTPEENDQHVGVGDYVGAARLWPWEIIYFRRLRKGAISMDNYARRVEQNKAFGITDKYIRGSSGWGELMEENF